MKPTYWLLLAATLICTTTLSAQDDDFDFSTLVPAEEVKAFCSSRILGGMPQKLVSIGYDVQGSYDMNVGTSSSLTRVSFPETDYRVNRTSEFRIDIQYPVISKNNITVALQLNYLRTFYDIENVTTNDELPFANTLDDNGLNSTNFSTVIFKPLNITNFLILQGGVSLNGDYTFADIQPLSYTRWFGAAIFGWKPTERKMWGLGVSRTYLGGALNYLPVFYYQFASTNGQWGLDVLLPSRLNVIYNFNKKTILSLGHNFQGNTYRLNALADNIEGGVDPELRRSELRFRAILDRAITRTVWFSVQAGLRYNWEFNVDDGDFFRSLFSDESYLFENSLGNPVFAQFSISWVSP
ncbi:MAG: DUF6268 family outer membrane beta-barrel protein [Bacteroidota bacterium]